MDPVEKLSRMESRVKAYLEARYPLGCTIAPHGGFMPCHVRLEVCSPDGRRGPTLVLPEEFADHGDEIERELDSRDVMGVMARAGRGTVIVPKFGPPVIEPGGEKE
ncbi:MAG: hypothetical protein ACE5IQ_10305 [Candidatus Methylomirabilales bacterium]